ncbi:MAG TPA: autotransporter-associated beta strand repeat-containing protein, partial [Candidatus Synoicihabitans sp.]|nr:autotransporter-associated beta strand repeat-containing protein [Candidatus Synoicihabitans sp.]
MSFALALAGSSALCAQQAITYTFRDASGSLFAPGSWVDGVVPPNDGSAALEFAPTSQIVADFGANGSFDAYSITLTLGSGSSLQLEDGFGGGTFGIGAGGVNVSGSFGYLWFSSSEVSLLGDQTWSATANTTIYALTTVSGTAELTLTGGGEFIFSDSNNTFSGDLLIDSGTLRVAGSSTLSDGVITSGPAGTGTLYLGSGVSLDVWGQEALLHNDVALGDSVEFGSSLDLPLTLAGVITPQQLATTVRLKSDSRVYFAGSLVESTEGTGSSFTFEGEGAAILDGTNSYTGGTTIDGAAVIFGNANALPATGTIAVLNGGYVGAAYEAGPQAILDQVTDVSTFTGTLGLDSDPDEAPNVFTDAFDFSDFDAEFFRGLGSFSHAVFSGTVTPVGGASYKFGGGSGWLIVTADLSHAGSGSLLVQSDPAYPLGLVLQGDNDFAGDMYVEGSVVVLDSANALPTGATISLGQYGYVGYTERFTGVTSFADFLSHFDSEGTDSSRTVGLDSADPTNPRTVADAIDLSEIDAASLGTATAVKLTGMISAPADGTLRLIGVKGGQLDVQSVLDSTRVARLEVGSSQLSFGADGLVRLAGDNTYTGGTTWFSGALVVGGDSALGAGPLDVRNPHPDRSPTLLSDLGTEVLLSNAITLEHGTLQIGLPTFLDPDGHEGKWSTYQGSDDARQLLTLTGDISGPASLYVSNYVTLTLGGANTFQFGTRVAENSLVIATSDTAFGEDGVHLERGADLEFRSAAPVVSGIGADGVRHTTDASYIALVDSAQTPVTLTLDLPGNDFRNLRAHIGGVPTDYTGTGAPPATNGALVKTGTGTLALRETST